jgi:ribosomal protein L12E/L44/L45/RPP1/RPP2
MKKLMTLMLGLSLALGSVAVAFGQDEPTKKEEKKKGGKKKGEDKKGDEQKKEFR